MGMLTVRVTADNSATSYAKETRAMKDRVLQMQNRANLIAQDISRRPNGSDPHYKLLMNMNNALVDLCDLCHTPVNRFEIVLGARAQLEHIARDIENTLQYMEHLNYLLGKASTS